MRWYKRRVTKRDRRIAREIAASFGVRYVKFSNDKSCDYFDLTPKGYHVIHLSVMRDRRWFYSALLHELSHSICLRARVFPAYHFTCQINELTIKQRLAIRRTAIRAELYVDHMAEQICNKLFNHMPYQRAYRAKRDRQFLIDYWRDR